MWRWHQITPIPNVAKGKDKAELNHREQRMRIVPREQKLLVLYSVLLLPLLPEMAELTLQTLAIRLGSYVRVLVNGTKEQVREAIYKSP